ncbi:hypothetical protein DFS34DRAFT_636434 [Phlyctochytrium arcticum]|nr:hypothetical protein DFS34DRAFT_636434 [Phlyctochytrium arcticum]
MLGLNTFRTSFLLFTALIATLYYYNPLQSPSANAPDVQRARRAPIPDVDRIIAPQPAQEFARGGSYNIQYLCSVQLEYVNVDLYMYQGERIYIGYLATNYTAAGPGVVATIPIKIAQNMRTGPSFVIKVWGPIKNSTEHYEVPDSSHFAILDPSAGTWNYPRLSPVSGIAQLFTGRQATLNYTLGTAFDGVASVRIDILSSDRKEYYTIADGLPTTGSQNTYTWVWRVPASLRLSQLYHLRILPTGSTLIPKNAVNAAFDVNLPVLNSAEFSIFPVPAMMDPAVSIQIQPKWIANASQTISWTYKPYPPATVDSWTVELYDTLLGESISLGRTLGSVANAGEGASLTIKVPGDLEGGIYFVRVWGLRLGTTASDNIDPVSGLSGLIEIGDGTVTAKDVAIVTAPAKWARGDNITVTWKFDSDLVVNGWLIDLYKSSVTYKLYTGIVNNTLPYDVRSATFVVPDHWMLNNDYQIRVRGYVQSPTSGLPQLVGGFSGLATVVENPLKADESKTRKGGGTQPTGSAFVSSGEKMSAISILSLVLGAVMALNMLVEVIL